MEIGECKGGRGGDSLAAIQRPGSMRARSFPSGHLAPRGSVSLPCQKTANRQESRACFLFTLCDLAERAVGCGAPARQLAICDGRDGTARNSPTLNLRDLRRG
eukprot:6065771-Pleurochrysis_carterae.AAC.1